MGLGTSAHCPVTSSTQISLKLVDTRLFLRSGLLCPQRAASTSNTGDSVDIKRQTLRHLVADRLNKVTRIRDEMTNNKTINIGKNNKQDPIIDTNRRTLW